MRFCDGECIDAADDRFCCHSCDATTHSDADDPSVDFVSCADHRGCTFTEMVPTCCEPETEVWCEATAQCGQPRAKCVKKGEEAQHGCASTCEVLYRNFENSASDSDDDSDDGSDDDEDGGPSGGIVGVGENPFAPYLEFAVGLQCSSPTSRGYDYGLEACKPLQAVCPSYRNRVPKRPRWPHK